MAISAKKDFLKSPSVYKSYRIGDRQNVSPDNDKLGDIVENMAQLEQCIIMLLMTPKDCVPHMDYGTDLYELIDKPINFVANKIRQEVIRTLKIETRVVVKKVEVFVSEKSNSRLKLSIDWETQNGLRRRTNFYV
jgi:phage baseplate assembly protein W